MTAAAMNAVPFAFTGVLAAMAGLNWIVGRRMKLMDGSGPPQAEPEDKTDE